jgi:CHAT domain-containing protein
MKSDKRVASARETEHGLEADTGVAELAQAVETGDGRLVCSFLGMKDIFGLNPERFASASIDLRVTALVGALTPLVQGRDLARGATMAEALLLAARRGWSSAQNITSAENYGSAADLAATARQRLGRQEEALALAREAPPAILPLTNGYRATSLACRGIDALIELGRLDEAQALLEDAKRYDDRYLAEGGQREPNLPFTEARLRQAVVTAAAPADERSVDAKAADNNAEAVRASVEGLARLGDMVPARILDQLTRTVAADSGASTAREVLERSSEGYQRLAGMLGVNDELMRNQIEIHEVSKLLLDPVGGRDSVKLRSMRERVGRAQAWFAASGHELDALDALWPIALISRRLNEHAAALDAMGRIRETIERRRLGMSDPLKTAALFSRFPYLYENIVLSALELGQINEALSAIEASKGRAIAELRSAREGAPDEEFSRNTLAAARAAARLDELTAALQVDYLSFFVGEDETIVVLATPSGDRRVERMVMPKSRLRTLMRQVDPGGWSNNFGATPVDRELAPLVEWVLPHLAAPTLVISPDDPLHNLPFHYLQTSRGRLIERVAMAKVHGADDLRAAFDNPATRPTRAKAVFLPARDEMGPIAERRASFERLCARLPLRLEAIDGERFDRSAAKTLTIPDGLLHLAAHGYWPPTVRRARAAPDTYGGSGVLLARDGMLPERGAPLEDALLSPRLVMESAMLDVWNAVVGIQACVSGLSTEGRAGDAVGLEWALVARGASTVLASHWNVDFTTAVAFFERFYAGWLVDGLSRAQASRRAMLLLRDDPALASHGLDWAAFTLIGEWR